MPKKLIRAVVVLLLALAGVSLASTGGDQNSDDLGVLHVTLTNTQETDFDLAPPARASAIGFQQLLAPDDRAGPVPAAAPIREEEHAARLALAPVDACGRGCRSHTRKRSWSRAE